MAKHHPVNLYPIDVVGMIRGFVLTHTCPLRRTELISMLSSEYGVSKRVVSTVVALARALGQIRYGRGGAVEVLPDSSYNYGLYELIKCLDHYGGKLVFKQLRYIMARRYGDFGAHLTGLLERALAHGVIGINPEKQYYIIDHLGALHITLPTGPPQRDKLLAACHGPIEIDDKSFVW